MRSGIFAAIAVLLLVSAIPCLAVDTDGDGIPDDVEELLGTDPSFAETLQVIYDGGETPEERRGEGYDASKDVMTIEFGHVAEDRYLWRTIFGAEPNLADHVHHIYVDADADETTGREGHGVEYMLTVAAGQTRSTYYLPNGTQSPDGPAVRTAVVGNSLYTSADVDLGRDEAGNVRFRMYVLSHSTTGPDQPRPAMSDSTGSFIVQGIPLNDREKVLRPGDLTENTNVAATFGLDVIRPTLVDERNVVIRYDELELEGYEVDIQTSRRYGHLISRGIGSTATHTVATPGRYHVGFLMYDDGSDERIVIHVNDEFAGLAAANVRNNRHWIYWLEEARELQAGDRVSFEAVGPSGKHGIARVLLMPEPPEVRGLEYLVENTNWIAPVGTDGEAWISWTTTWPSASRFEYGPTTDYGEVATEDVNRLVHRARLTGLDPGVTYHGRGVGLTPEGEEYYGPDITFTADGIDPPQTAEGVNEIPLIVRNRHDADAVAWPVSSGVPFPQGALGSESDLRLMLGGEEVVAQFRPLGTWPDGSIKWVLVTILADVPAGESADYVLQYGREIDAMTAAARYTPIAREQGDGVILDTGAVELAIDVHGQLVGPNGPIVTELVETVRGAFSSALSNAELTIEENGPVRAVVKTEGDLVVEDGSESFRIEQRIEAWRDRPFVRVHHTFTNTLPDDVSATTLDTVAAGRFVDIERISLVLPAEGGSWQAPLRDGEPLELSAGDSVWQRFHDEFEAAGGDAVTDRIIGGLVADGGAMAVTVRDFWQQYPKGFEIAGDAVRVDLAPDFEAGLYDEFPFEAEGHQLFYYLRDGSYTFTRGMAKTHELLLDFGEGAAARSEIFQEPLLLTAEPEWYCDSNVFYNVAPRDEERFAAYEEAIDRNLENYVAARERQRDFGMMNYGDWYGERGANWGNIEYDTQHAFFLEYIRSGNPDAFLLGEAAQIHNRDIDTVQWSPDGRETGLVWVHQMGHVGGYYDESVPGTLGIPRSGGNMGHAWTEGHFGHYALTGDRRSLETGMAVVDYWTNRELSRPYDWTSARVPGWHLIMLASALATTNDPYYLNASRIVIDRVLETQDTEPRELHDYQKEPGRTHQVGGWTRQMVPGHCLCEPRHRGNANFMIAVLLAGMNYYHDVTQEPEVKESIILGAHFLMDDFYSTETHGFRYTSCPEMRYRVGVSPVYMVEGIARVYRWTGDEKFLDPLTNGLAYGAGGSGYGKGFSSHYRSAPRVLADLAEMGLSLEERRVEDLAPFTMPDWMAELGEDEMIVIQAEDFADQGESQVQVRDDRHATWGTMITYWHQVEGHWLDWNFEVPADGNYRVIFRYATSSENTRRKFEVNGEVPHEAAAEIAFPSSGGFGNSPMDWEYLPLQDDDGNDVVLALSAGEHTIRMTNLGDGLGMDFMVLVREE
ncbi:MAG: hypothetical protein ACOX9R_12695 [Armatimonadota bacterium]|jgi:hypothetical protein